MSGEKMETTNVKVMVRMRLFNKKEMKISEEKKEELRPCIKMRGNTCAIVEFNTDERGFTHEREREAFDFDECFWSMPMSQYPFTEKEYATQLYVYQRSGLLALKAALEGYHVCIFAYGQTSSGKTYSMLGTHDDPGISPRLVDDLFAHIAKNKNPAQQVTVECMFFEIYNEKVRDLFNKASKAGEYANPRIRNDRIKGVYVEGLLRKECTSSEQTKELIEKGMTERAVAETKMNPTSSRSHAIFQIIVLQTDAMKGTKKTSYLNLVDLAGSERIRQSQVTGSNLVEATNINKSLSTLRRVIDVLIENTTTRKQQVPPFRDSILTYVLSDSLGGNSKTQMLATVSPHEVNIEDTIGTLRYALRARSIVCEAKVNEEESAAAINRMRDELQRLYKMKESGVTNVNGEYDVPEDIQRELAEKEAEVAKMEAEQSKMNELMAQLKSQMQEMDLAKQELAVAITEQKRERFASAFRNAFLISSDKQRIAEHLSDLTNLRQDNTNMRRDLAIANAELSEKREHNGILLRENNTLNVAVQQLREELDTTVSQLQQQNRNLSELKNALEAQLNTTEQKLADVTSDCERATRRIETMTMDLTGLTHAAEREQIEKSRVRSSFEEAVMRHMRELESLRKKKELYKQTAAEEKQKSSLLQKTIANHEAERSSLLETVKALQALLREKDFLVATAHSQCDEANLRAEGAVRKLEEQNQTVEGLREAIKEYQRAAQQWMGDLALKDREVARLSALSQDNTSTKLSQDYQKLRMSAGHHVSGTTIVTTPVRRSDPMQMPTLPSSVRRTLSPRSPQSAVLMSRPISEVRAGSSNSPMRYGVNRN